MVIYRGITICHDSVWYTLLILQRDAPSIFVVSQSVKIVQFLIIASKMYDKQLKE